jgi:hypothetical protein
MEVSGRYCLNDDCIGHEGPGEFLFERCENCLPLKGEVHVDSEGDVGMTG